MPFQKRKSPYLYATWLADHISGKMMCDFQLWFKANHQNWTQPPNDFDTAKWLIAHTQFLRTIISQLPDSVENSLVEDQASFWTNVNGVTISGKPDILVFYPDNKIVVVDAKTGKPNASHEVQMQLYMWDALERYAPTAIHAELRYTDYPTKIVSAPGSSFHQALNYSTHIANLSTPPTARPSKGECRFCNIAATHCELRIE